MEIVTGAVAPPDFTTFWNQAAQQGLKPKVATIGKALFFPASVAAPGSRADAFHGDFVVLKIADQHFFDLRLRPRSLSQERTLW